MLGHAGRPARGALHVYGVGTEGGCEPRSTVDPAGGEALQGFGWRIGHPEAPGTGRYFGGINAIEVNADASYTGYADPRHTTTAAG